MSISGQTHPVHGAVGLFGRDCGSKWLCPRLISPRVIYAWKSLPIATASIAPKEFFPILVASVIWGHYWRGCTVCSHCDNTAVVDVINTRKAKDPLLCHQLCALFFASAFFDFELIAAHTPGQENGAADALSRNMLPSFLTQVPNAAHTPSQVPMDLQLGLSTTQPCWKSPEWTAWFTNTITRH